MQKDYLGTVNIKGSEAFTKFTKGICKTLKAEQHDISVVEVINLTERIDTVNGTNTIAKQASKQVEVIGSLDSTFESTNRIYSANGVAPTVCTYCGGNQEAKVLEVKKLEQCIVAMRGRNPENPSDRTPGIDLEQRLEVNSEGICNTLTSVQKDNLVLEKKSIKIRQATKNYYDFIYSEREINERSTIEILCLLREKIDDEEIFKWAIRGLWCVLAKEILQQNVYAKSIFENWRNKPELFQLSYYSERNKQVNLTEKQVREMWEDWEIRCSSYRRKLEQQYRGKFDDFMQKLSYENSSSKEIVCYMWKTCKGNGILQQALSEVQEIWQSLYDLGESYYLIRIRKLVPKCCWRLMSFTDDDFDKAASVNSNTQLYKQAGNSIVKAVMMAIFRQML